jgi:repressor LexA
MALTRRQREVLDVIGEFIRANGYSPSLEEIGASLGLSSVATVHRHVSILVEKGYLQRAWNQNRSIELVDADPPGVVRLPLLGNIPAGRPLEAVAVRETFGVPADMVRRREASYVLKVRGDSMLDEQIRDGDFVIVEARSSAANGETVVALIDGDKATLKRFSRKGPLVRLEPANSAMQPIVLAASRVQIQGVAVGVLRRYW